MWTISTYLRHSVSELKSLPADIQHPENLGLPGAYIERSRLNILATILQGNFMDGLVVPLDTACRGFYLSAPPLKKRPRKYDPGNLRTPFFSMLRGRNFSSFLLGNSIVIELPTATVVVA